MKINYDFSFFFHAPDPTDPDRTDQKSAPARHHTKFQKISKFQKNNNRIFRTTSTTKISLKQFSLFNGRSQRSYRLLNSTLAAFSVTQYHNFIPSHFASGQQPYSRSVALSLTRLPDEQ